MKTINLIALLGTLLLSSCIKEREKIAIGNELMTRSAQECITTVDLMAGQNTVIGNVTIFNDAFNLYVTYTTTGGWLLDETHLFVGEFDDMPTTPLGNPKIGLFPYASVHDGISTYTYTIPLDWEECITIATHAAVYKEEDGIITQAETAWGEGEQISQAGSWAMMFEYCNSTCCEVIPENFTIYGGQYYEAGSLEVTNDADSVYVSYHFNEGWTSQTVQLYVGSVSQLPVNGAGVPIPGHFPYSYTSNTPMTDVTFSISLDQLDECFIIAAHSELTLLDEEGSIIQSETGWSYGTPFSSTNRWGWFSEYCVQGCE